MHWPSPQREPLNMHAHFIWYRGNPKVEEEKLPDRLGARSV